ncbi:hypothetical protein AAG906_016991 [Vitis piasezkii]
MELLGDGYQGDVIGESTPDVLVNEFKSLPSCIGSLSPTLTRSPMPMEVSHAQPTVLATADDHTFLGLIPMPRRA